jgi:hypothetical protein
MAGQTTLRVIRRLIWDQKVGLFFLAEVEAQCYPKQSKLGD